MNTCKYELAVAAYLDWCEAEKCIPEQPSEVISEVNDDMVFLRNIDGELGVFHIRDDVAERVAGWKPVEKAMFAAGEAIQAFVKDRPFPANEELEVEVWEPQLREKLARETFREVCNNLRFGWSPLGDD